MQEPSEANSFLLEHIQVLDRSHKKYFGCSIWSNFLGYEYMDGLNEFDLARAIYHAPFVLLSHGTQSDPIFNYANLSGQKLFEMEWDVFVHLPSRLSATPLGQEDRSLLMQKVSDQGFIKDYQGLRVSKSGALFEIKQAIVWNVISAKGSPYGQAAIFQEWDHLKE